MGREFGTIGARRGDTIVEVTTYRADAYDGVTRKPVVAFGDSLEDDLKSARLHVNAMALRLPGPHLRRPARRGCRPRPHPAHARPPPRCPSVTTRCG
jgi:poly(A) polymerase